MLDQTMAALQAKTVSLTEETEKAKLLDEDLTELEGIYN